MDTVIIGIIITISVLLVLVVLAQNSKGGGVSSTFGSTGTQAMGTKRTTDFLEKLTWGLIVGVLGLSLLTNIMIKGNKERLASPNLDAAKDKTVITPGATTAPEIDEDDIEAEEAEAQESAMPSSTDDLAPTLKPAENSNTTEEETPQ